MTRALVPGTYDPITFGHIDVIERSAQIFDEVIVAVAASPKKGSGPLFSLQQRLEFTCDATKDLPNCQVMTFSTLLVDFASEQGVSAIVKGLRAVTDFEMEFQQAATNYQLNPTLETLFIMANPGNMYLSSSMVKEVASLGGDISMWVTPMVQRALSERFAGNSLAK